MNGHRYRTGEGIPKDGIYRVWHDEHRLPTEVTLRKGADFPGCANCEEVVEFELVRTLELTNTKFLVTLHRIPPLDEPKAA